MIEENLKAYLASMQKEIHGELRLVYDEAKKLEIPIIRDDTISLLSIILKTARPKKILELGTGSGFSSLFFSDCLNHDVQIVTVDRYEKMIVLAQNNFEKMNAKNIKLVKADIKEYLPNVLGKECFDLIFLDSAKSQYYALLDNCIDLLNNGGLLIADDVMQNGTIALEKNAIERRHRTRHEKLNLFLHEISKSPKLDSSILAVGDGLSISRKI